MAEIEALVSPERVERYRRCVSQAKQEARNGNLEESIRFFKEAHEIHPSEKLITNIQKLEEALASLALNQEEDGFVNVCESGLLLYGEMYDKLFDHQREGIAFLYSLYRDGRKGGILADDMGLGKTIQIIAFLSGMFDSEHIRSVLLAMPTTLVNTWMKEFASWTPGLRVKVFHGTSKVERNRSLERIQKRNGVLITTYQMILNNWQQLSSCEGREFVWDYVILDEAHKIKTPSAKTTKSVHAIPSRNRILLTGTPVQNNLQELWALFDFACQGSLLGTMKTFRMEYENPITRAREKDATPGEKALGLKMSENLMSIIKPYFLRRSKDDIQKKLNSGPRRNLAEDQSKAVAPEMPSLPRKNDFIVWVYVAPAQEEIYRNFLSLDHIKELLMTTRSPLAELNVLKKLCDHPRLLSARACSQLGLATTEYSEREEGDENEADELWGQNMDIERISDKILIEESGKVRFLIALLDRLREEGHRTLVFSQSRKMLDIIERILTHRSFKLMRIDGTVTHLLEREKRIDAFQNGKDYSVFLLTTQVGGVGLTLTAATRVVIFDPSWNPATDAQAVDRAYRIGQKENVVIYRLITCGTVEEKIYRRQVFKDSLIRQTTGDKKNPYRYFTKQELRELFTLGDTRSSATQLQLQSLHGTQRKTDIELDEHIAYLYSLEIFGLSDHDLMYTRETGHEDEAEDEEAHRYIEHRVQKAQELVQLESQLKDQLGANSRHTTEGAWLRATESAIQPRKKSPRPSPAYSAPSPVPARPPNGGDVISVETDDEEELANVSFKMTSLVIEDASDGSPAADVSHMDVSLSKAEETRHGSVREGEQKHSLSSSPSCFVSNEDSSGSKTASHEPAAVAKDCFNEACVERSVEYISDDDDDIPEAQAKMEMSLEVLGSPCREASQALMLQASETSEHGASLEGEQESGRSDMLARDEPLVSSSLYQADFELVLEDSVNQPRDVSDKGMLLEETENSGFRLRLDSHCSSAAHSGVGGNRSMRSPLARENMTGSLATDSSSAARSASMDNSDVFVARKKKLVQRIVSDSEEDEEGPVIYLGEHGKAVPSDNPAGICASTPKSSGPLADLCFSPLLKLSERRSTASRRSLAYVVFDQVEDVAENITETSPERHFPHDLEEGLAQESSGRESAEERLGETPCSTGLSEGKSSYLDEADSPPDSSVTFEEMVP